MIPAELIKMRSLRATPITLILTVVVCAGLSYLLGLSGASAAERGRFDPVFFTYYGVLLGQFALVVFGVFAMGGEYSSGTVRPSLLAMPRRGRFYASKIIATALVALATAVVAVTLTYLAARAGLGDYKQDLGDRDMLAGFVGATLYLALMPLFAMGVATMVRSSAIALGVLMPVLFLGSQGLGNAPKAGVVLQFLPDQAGATILHIAGRPDSADYSRDFGPWTGLAILAVWTALSLLGGYLVLRRRDA
jgi:ABC-2 type transport system permease protein